MKVSDQASGRHQRKTKTCVEYQNWYEVTISSDSTLFYKELSLGFSGTHIASIFKLETFTSAIELVILMNFERKWTRFHFSFLQRDYFHWNQRTTTTKKIIHHRFSKVWIMDSGDTLENSSNMTDSNIANTKRTQPS